ncbi:uncharacterized protein LOC112247153 isoform X3 [Oncorhynchus tshawytscha]|uniref:uncharacterized protein LOC112247153 isoform X3 n=1 Tax=Oncorhynchus tshawytscha TaxID=74940 RepID=UPI001C3DD76B|nr:uncharacterized protein LOC112247153 isoform X3 [Oncorhynchus tshawytscha]
MENHHREMRLGEYRTRHRECKVGWFWWESEASEEEQLYEEAKILGGWCMARMETFIKHWQIMDMPELNDCCEEHMSFTYVCKACFCSATSNKYKYCTYAEDETEDWPKDGSYVNILLYGRITARSVTEDSQYLKSRYWLKMEDGQEVSYGMIQRIDGLMLGVCYDGGIMRRGTKRKECSDAGEGVTRDEKNLPTPSSNGDHNTGHSRDLMEPWTAPAETGQRAEAEEIPIIDFSQLTLDIPPMPPPVVETTSWYD